MQDYTRSYSQSEAGKLSINEGLRQFFVNIYNHMGLSLAVTGLVSYIFGTNEALFKAIYGTPAVWLVMFSPIIFVMVLSYKIARMQPKTAALCLYAFSGLMGVSTAYIFQVYTTVSIASTFFMTAGVFGGMSLFGYLTKKDLTAMGSFLIMGLWAIIIVSLVNIFLGNPAISYVISLVAVFIFIGLTAYDTQRLKSLYYQVAGDGTMANRMAVLGALNLYMDFINLFLHLLRFFGDRK